MDQQLEKGDSEEAVTDEVDGDINEDESNTKIKENNQQKETDSPEHDEQESNQEVDTEPMSVNEDGHGLDDDQLHTLAERIEQGVYETHDPPNGFPLPIPYDWHLVEVINDGVGPNGHEYWEGVFCFEEELESTISNMEQTLGDYDFDVISDPIDSESTDNVHSTKFNYVDPHEGWNGDMIYLIDIHGSTCTEVYLELTE